MKFLIYSIFVLLLAPCNKSKQLGNATDNVSDNSKVIIIYQCSVCFGRCPAFIMTIDGASKQITFNGQSDTDKIGTYTKTISDAEITNLVSAFEKINFFSFEDKYLGTITDFPSKYTTYSNNGKTKKIQDRSGAPGELRTLENMLQTIADSDGWKKSDIEDH